MELTKNKIVKNAKRYVEAARKYGALNDKLEDVLGGELVTAPASTSKHLNNAFEGGLIDHTLRVMKHAYKLNDTLLIDELKVDETSLFKVVLLHGIGKVKLFLPNSSQWHKDNQGKMYNFNEDLVSMRVGERSAFYALSCGIELSDEEFASIVNHDKVSDAQSEYHNTTLGDILKIAIKLAIMEEQFLNEK